jgi:hypothetical protein
MNLRCIQAAVLATLCAVCFLIHGPSLRNEFVIDDAAAVTANPNVNSPKPWKFLRIWTQDYWIWLCDDGRAIRFGDDRNLYRPVTVAVNMLNSMITGISSAKFRAVNILLHVCAAWLVGLWCGAWMGRRAGVLAALVMLLHPLATDVINRVVGRADILAVIGMAGALWVQRQKGRAWLIPLFLFSLVAVGAKESGILVVPLALVQTWVGMAGPGVQRREAGWQLGVVLAPATLLMVLRWAVVGVPGYDPRPDWDVSDNPAFRMALADRLPLGLGLVWYYARQMIWPWPMLAYDQPLEVAGWRSADCWAGAFLVLLMLYGVVKGFQGRRVAVIGLTFWLGQVVLVSQVIRPIGDYRAARMAYSMVPAVAFLAAGFLAERVWARRALRGTLLGILAGLMAAGITVSVRRTRDFRNDLSLLEADVLARPDGVSSLIRLGSVYVGQNRHDEADRVLQRAAQLRPRQSEA